MIKFSIMTLVPKHIKSLLPYTAGKPIEEVKRQLGLKRLLNFMFELTLHCQQKEFLR